MELEIEIAEIGDVGKENIKYRNEISDTLLFYS